MFLPVCDGCPHGGIKEGKSHCGREACYSYLSKCIQKKALEDYLERHASERVEDGNRAMGF